MDFVAQLVRASVCGSEGRGFETHHYPQNKVYSNVSLFYALKTSIVRTSPPLFLDDCYTYVTPKLNGTKSSVTMNITFSLEHNPSKDLKQQKLLTLHSSKALPKI